jgi:hypothetical protein
MAPAFLYPLTNTEWYGSLTTDQGAGFRVLAIPYVVWSITRCLPELDEYLVLHPSVHSMVPVTTAVPPGPSVTDWMALHLMSL